MHEFIQLLEQIELRPPMYIGEHNIHCLKAFLDGWLLGNAKSTEPMNFMVRFQAHIAKKYRILSTQSWAHILAFYSPNLSAALDLAFREFQDFRKEDLSDVAT